MCDSSRHHAGEIRKALLYMKREVPGVKINDEYIDRMRNVRNPKEEGIEIAIEMITLLSKIKGIMRHSILMPCFMGKYHTYHCQIISA